MKMGKANKLSRRLDWKVGVEKNNENQKKEQIQGLIEVVVKGPEVDIIEKIRIAREKNKKIVRVVEETEVKMIREDK